MRATVNGAALQHNCRMVRHIVGDSGILAVLKGNAYGHGAVFVAEQLSAMVQGFGVVTIEEAILLREAGITKPIVLLEGFHDDAEIAVIEALQLATVVHSMEQLVALEAASLKRPIATWLKVNTGMNRLGFSGAAIPTIYQRLVQASWVEKPVVLMTHLANATRPNDAMAQQQIVLFDYCSQELVCEHSLANSAAIINFPEAHRNWVRPGGLLYGVSLCQDKTAQEMGLKPVLSLQAKLIAIQHCEKGAFIGYGGAWRCPELMPIGIVSAGYGDGYPRHAEVGTPVLVGGEVCPIVARVAMDTLAIDLRNASQAAVGQEVLLWGDELPIETIADYASTIAYELTAKLTSRVSMTYSPAPCAVALA